ncbi:presenilins-associated rhomboid-like protein, mitochondrial [Ostrea edulis]|uniref:presenilins-associated rhomboid-like protein, mitochondrial n=1 Tax=Ostrea edulis TaxID=37623 RepID=UPI0020960C02|nr:presenilins-associated rhomboid-like protein, mitochondrial [Ostrea edulis]
MSGSLIVLCRFPAKRSLESLTSICRNSHGLKDVCSSRLLLPKGENGSLIQKQFIRGGRGTKKTPYPEYESDGSRLFKHFQLTVTVCGCSFVGSMIWQYENIKQKIKEVKHQINAHGEFRMHYVDFTNLVSGIIVANVAVFAMWKIPRLLPFMQRYFLCSPCRSQSVFGGFFAAFSHDNFFHLFCNMYVLWSFSAVTLNLFGKEQFLAVYLSGAALSSFLSICNKVLLRIPTASVGASGAICALIGATCVTYPDGKLSIALVNQIFPHSFTAQSGLIGLITLDTLGILLRWKLFDHAAHLGGTLFGIWYVKYGQDLIWKKRESFLQWWHKIRESKT